MLFAMDMILLYLAVLACIAAAAAEPFDNVPRNGDGRWITTWVAMPQLTEPANLPPAPYVCRENLRPEPFADGAARMEPMWSLRTRRYVRLYTCPLVALRFVLEYPTPLGGQICLSPG